MCRTTQSHRIQLHQHQVFDQRFRQIRLLAHGKRKIVEHRQIGEQTVLLELHADLAAQFVQHIVFEGMYVLPHHLAHALVGLQLTADQAQQSRFATAAAAHDAHHFAARYRKVDALEYLARRIGKRETADLDYRFNSLFITHGTEVYLSCQTAENSKTSTTEHTEHAEIPRAKELFPRVPRIPWLLCLPFVCLGRRP